MSTGYPTNIPRYISDAAGANQAPEASSYPVGTYNSAPALYDLVTSLYAVDKYRTTGAQIIIPTGYWALGTKPNAALDCIIPMYPRMTFRGETGNPENSALVRSNGIQAHMFSTGHIVAGDAGTDREPAGVAFLGLTVNGNWANGADGDHDIIHWEKPINGAWFDSYLKIWDCKIEKAKRHCVYVSSRGDIRIERNRFEGSGDSAIKVYNSPDSHFNNNHIVGAGKNSIEFVDSTNWEINFNIAYFGGQNQRNRWDGSVVENVRMFGGGFFLDNCGSIRGVGNRIEDTSGSGLILRSPGGIALKETYFNSLGSVGSLAQKNLVPKRKDFASSVPANLTAVVEGVDCVFFDRTNSNGNKLGDGVYIHGYARQAREWQQIRHITQVNAPNNTWRPGRDIEVDVQPWPDEFQPDVFNVDETTKWEASGRGSYWVSPGLLASNSWPTTFERARFTWKGELMPAFHGRNSYLRSQRLNPYDDEVVYNINVASASATATAATWSGGTNSDGAYAVTYTLSADIRSAVGVTSAVRISGMTNAPNNGVFNVKAITANSVTVHNRNRSSSTGDETGSSGTCVGPSPALILAEGLPRAVYEIRVSNKAASTESLRVYKESDGSLLTTITSAGITKVSKYAAQGWLLI
jgi:hypothetical protein